MPTRRRPGLTPAEAAAAADHAAQEAADALAPPLPTLSPGYVRGVRPDNDVDAVFVPGEQLPTWAAELLPKATRDRDGVYLLPAPH